MSRGVLGQAVVALVATVLVSTGCSAPTASSAPSAASTARTWSIVALGDSVPYGTNCDCTPYPPLTAKDLANVTGHTVTATNDSVPGYTTANVLKQLTSDPKVIDHVTSADAVEIEVGANDVGYSDSCGPVPECYAPKLPAIESNLGKIVARVHELTAGHEVLVVLLDYWSVWLGGKYAADQGEQYVSAATQVTDDVNTIIKATADSAASAYVDLRTAFKGPDHAYDETHYLSDDGDHPNAAGHEQIALAAEAVIQSTLHI